MIHSISPIQSMKHLPAAIVGEYIGDAPAKSGVRFGTLENTGYKKSTPNLVACFFNADSPLSRLLKSSRVSMVGCMGVVPCVLRTKPVQPATHSLKPLCGQDNYINTTEGCIMPISNQTSVKLVYHLSHDDKQHGYWKGGVFHRPIFSVKRNGKPIRLCGYLTTGHEYRVCHAIKSHLDIVSDDTYTIELDAWMPMDDYQIIDTGDASARTKISLVPQEKKHAYWSDGVLYAPTFSVYRNGEPMRISGRLKSSSEYQSCHDIKAYLEAVSDDVYSIKLAAFVPLNGYDVINMPQCEEIASV